jgi:hypothetical protein
MDKYTNDQFSITMSFTKIIQNASKLYAGRPKIASAFGMCFRLSIFGIIILHTKKQYKVKSNYKKR